MSRHKQRGRDGKPQTKVRRRKVFVSFHDADSKWRRKFTKLMEGRIADYSVKGGDISVKGRPIEDILREIREKHIANATVTVVLIGPCTWRRRFVDWEIHASIRCTNANPRTGLLGIVLPCHPEYGKTIKDEHLLPPRLADNLDGDHPFARVYDWPDPFNPSRVAGWINKAFKDRELIIPDSSRDLFVNNRKGQCAKGWQ